MIRKHFNDVFFDGQSLADFGVHVSGDSVFSAPERVYTTQEVPGRNGALHIDEGRFKSVTLKYPAFIADENFSYNVMAFRNFMLSRIGEKRLEDTYHPEEFRLALFKGPIDLEAIMLHGANFDLEFECTGERFLIEGEISKEFIGNGTIINPTYFPSRPLIRVYGWGTLGIGENTIAISQHPYSYIDIDCKLMDAYYDATNCNQFVTLTVPFGKSYIELAPGSNGVVPDNGISRVIIWPKWWMV